MKPVVVDKVLKPETIPSSATWYGTVPDNKFSSPSPYPLPISNLVITLEGGVSAQKSIAFLQFGCSVLVKMIQESQRKRWGVFLGKKC